MRRISVRCCHEDEKRTRDAENFSLCASFEFTWASSPLPHTSPEACEIRMSRNREGLCDLDQIRTRHWALSQIDFSMIFSPVNWFLNPDVRNLDYYFFVAEEACSLQRFVKRFINYFFYDIFLSTLAEAKGEAKEKAWGGWSETWYQSFSRRQILFLIIFI